MREAVKDIQRLRHILLAIERINRYISGKERDDLLSDDMMYYAVVKNIEIIGEAAYMLTEEFRSTHNQTPWKMIIGMRHYIVHEYFQIDSDVVWDVITNDLAKLKEQIETYIKPE